MIWQDDVDTRLKWGTKEAVKLGLIKKGDTIIAVQGWKGGLGNTNTYVNPSIVFCFWLFYPLLFPFYSPKKSQRNVKRDQTNLGF